MEKEAKKEAFRKYLESAVLVALLEENEKPSSALEFLQQKLGGPSIYEHEKLQAEMSDLKIKYNQLLLTLQNTYKQLEELKQASAAAPSNEAGEGDK